MAGGNIGPKIGVEGASEFKSTISSLNASLKTMGAEMQKVTSEFIGNEKSQEALSEQNKVLSKQLDTLNEKLRTQKERLSFLASQGKENTDEYVRLTGELYKTETALNKTKAEIQSNTEKMDGLGKETEDAAVALDAGANASKRFGDYLKANLLSDAIMSGIKALGKGLKSIGESVLDAAAAADELNTLSIKTGIATDTLQEFSYMAGLIDVDLETITGSFTKLTRNMATAADGSGAASDAFEKLGVSVTDGNGELRDRNVVFQEVITALGEMTNETERDAIAMDIFGRSAQDLNPLIATGADRLEDLKKEAHDLGYVMSDETLGSLNGVQDAMDRLNMTTDGIKNQLAAALAPTIEGIAKKMQEWAQSVDWEAVGEKITTAFDKVQEFGKFITENGDTIVAIIAGIGAGFVMWNVATMIHGLVTAIKAFQLANEGATIAQAALNVVMNANPIGIIITAVTALTAGIITLWNTNEDFRNWVKQAWEDIKGFFVGAWETVQGAWSNAVVFFTNIWTGIKGAFSTVKETLSGFFSSAWESIKSYWNNSAIGQYFQMIWDVIKGIFAAVKSVLSGDFSGALDAIKGTWDSAVGYFRNLWDGIKNVFSNVWEEFSSIGENIVKGIWDGISGAWEWFSEKVSGFFKNIVDGVKQGLGIASPSKVFAGIGENMALGLGVGWDKTMDQVERDMMSSIPMADVNATINGGTAVTGGAGFGMVEEITIPVQVGDVELARVLYRHIVGEGQRIGAAMVT